MKKDEEKKDEVKEEKVETPEKETIPSEDQDNNPVETPISSEATGSWVGNHSVGK